MIFLYLRRSKKTKKTKCSCFFAVGFFQGLSLACLVGLLLFMEWDFFNRASHLLVVSSCLFLVKVDFFRACHWPAWWACCFLEVDFSIGLLVCLLSLAAMCFL